MEAPTYRVTWVSSEGESCHTDGALVLVNQEQVIVTHGPHAVCCIPRRSVTLIERQPIPIVAPAAESPSSTAAAPIATLSSTKPTTTAPSAATDGRDAGQNWMFEGDY